MRKMKRVRTLAVAFMVGALSLSTLMSSASDFLATEEESTAVETTAAPETEPETPAEPETEPETPAAPETEPETPAEPETEPETEPTEPETDPVEETTPTQPTENDEVLENEEGKIEVSYSDMIVQVNQEDGILIPSLVEEVLNKLDNKQVIINLDSKDQQVPSSLLQAAKGKDVVLTFYMEEGGYSFDIAGVDITDENSANGINLSVSSQDAALDEQVKTMIPENSTGVVYDFQHSGILPTTTVTVPTTGIFDENEHLYCYYVNEAENRLELVGDPFVIGGLASFTIEHCSKYVLSDVKIDGAVTETEPSETTPSETTAGDNETETAAENETAETAGETNETAETQTAADTAAQSSEAGSSSPSTGDTMNPIFYVGLAAFAAILAVAAIKLFGRKPENRN
ncbi:MAG: hypothetical protein ACLU6W_13825 [Lachnospiraceae bacterium]